MGKLASRYMRPGWVEVRVWAYCPGGIIYEGVYQNAKGPCATHVCGRARLISPNYYGSEPRHQRTTPRVTKMKTHARVLAAVLSSWACFAYTNTAAAEDHHYGLKGEVIPVDIYDPTGLVSRHGELISLQAGFSF